MTRFKQLRVMDNCRKNMRESAKKLIQFNIVHSLSVTKYEAPVVWVVSMNSKKRR
jgi:hypothetical protein